MTYFHPRDFDKGQPIIKDLSYYRLFKSYYGLKSSFPKAEKLLNDFGNWWRTPYISNHPAGKNESKIIWGRGHFDS